MGGEGGEGKGEEVERGLQALLDGFRYGVKNGVTCCFVAFEVWECKEVIAEKPAIYFDETLWCLLVLTKFV